MSQNHNKHQHQSPPKATPPAAPPQPPATEEVKQAAAEEAAAASGEDLSVLDAPMAATVSVEAVREEKRAEAARIRANSIGRTETVVITPRENIANMRFGKSYFSFEKGKSVRVIAELARHLRERDLC